MKTNNKRKALPGLIFSLFLSLSSMATNYYWIGGTGNYNDVTHWATSSGGVSGGVVPTLADNVFFDSNSFTGVGQTVTINVISACANMDWTGATNSPTLAGTLDLNIYGSLTFISAMTNNFTGKITFKATATGKTITSAGKTFGGNIYFDGVSGGWTLQDAFNSTTKNVYLVNGDLNTNGQNFTTNAFLSNYNNTRNLTLGASNVTITGSGNDGVYGTVAWSLAGSNYTFSVGTSTINISSGSSATLYTGNSSYNVVIFQSTTITQNIIGGIFYDNVTFKGTTGNVTTTSATFNTLTFQQAGNTGGNNNIYTNYSVGGAATIGGNTNGFNNITFPASGTINNTGNTFGDVLFSTTATITGNNHIFGNVTVTQTSTLSASGLTCTTAKFLQNGTLSAGGHTIGKATFMGDGTISGSSSFDSLVFSPAKNYILGSNTTQTINNYFLSDGTCGQPINISSSTPGTQANISSALPSLTVNYLSLKDINATGGAVFTASNCTDLGNNTGWTINLPGAQNLFWIGGTGNYNDGSHWATTSGGAASGCIPTLYDNVFFDANSFSGGGQAVTVNVNSACANMDWTGATLNPVLTGTVDLNVYGSLTLISAMSNNFTGKITFKATATGKTITSAGKTYGGNIYFDGVGGGWTLQDAFSSTTKNIYLVNGDLNTNGKNFTTNAFLSNYNNIRNLTLGASNVTITGSGNDGVYGTVAWSLAGSNYTFSAGTSTVNISSGSSATLYTGNSSAYNNVIFQSTTTTQNLIGGIFYNSVLFKGTTGNCTTTNANFNTLSFQQTGNTGGDGNTYFAFTVAGAGTINGNNNNFPNITFPLSGTINNTGNTFGNVTFSQIASINGASHIFANVVCTQTATVNGTGHTFTTAKFMQVATLSAGGHSFGKATFMSDGTISGNSSYDSLIFSPGKTYILGSNTTQTINNYFLSDGTCGLPLNISASTAGTQANINSALASVTVNFVRLKDINATGGAVFTANNCTDLGNNTGWTINLPGAQNLYWIGGTGNYNDANHWSTSSGGVSSGCIPTLYDNVFFDANSFSGGGQAVTINVNSACANMTWTGATLNPVLAGTLDLNIHGSLTLINAMSISYSGKVSFKATATGKTITSAGRTFGSPVYFDGVGGGWTLQDAFNTSTKNVYLVNGDLNTNSKNFTTNAFLSNYNNTRNLVLGASNVTITGSGNDGVYGTVAWSLAGSNYTLAAGTSTVNITSTSSATLYTDNSNVYNNVVFQSTTTTQNLIGGISYNSVLFKGTTGNCTTTNANFNSLSFQQTGNTGGNGNNYLSFTVAGAGTINGNNNTFPNVTFPLTGTINGTANTFGNVTFTQTSTINGTGHVFGKVKFTQATTINGANSFVKADFLQNGTIKGTNTYDSLIFAAGKTYTLTNGTTQNVNLGFVANGTSGNLITISSSTSAQAMISKNSCDVCCSYLFLTSIGATGGAAFYATTSTNVSGNTGWNFGSCPSTTLTVGPISGAANACINTFGNVYSIPSLGTGATYTWTVPGGSTIASGQGTPNITVDIGSTAGTISVTANACGTSNGAGKTITVNPVPVVSSVSVTLATCSKNDGSATAIITSGTSPYNYVWSSGDTLALADSLVTGQYQLTVSDIYGCYTSTLVTVNSSNGPVVSLSNSTNVTCNGSSTGSLTVSVVGGTLPYTYAWTSGSTAAVANNLMAGTYFVTISDSAGCQTIGNYTITQPSPMNLSLTFNPSACASSTGDATVVATGGTPGYTYQWSANAASQTTSTATALAAGLYSVVVTDLAGCTQSGSVMVSTNTAGASIALNNITAGTCGTNGPGGVNITTSGGAFPYTWSWSNGSTNEDLTGASPGTYSLGVIDANGCMTFTTFVVPYLGLTYQPEICLVTVDTSSPVTSNLIAWEKTGAVGIKQFNIYCEIGSFNNYQLVGSVPGGNLSEFIHVGANPFVKSWKYKISAVDSCGTESPLSSYHKTIHLQVSVGNGGVMNLSWDNYYGFNYGSFEVWRYHISTNWVQLATIPFCGFVVCSNSFTDATPFVTDTNWYAILVAPPVACVTTARLADPNGNQTTIIRAKSNITNNRTGGSGIGIKESDLKNKFSVYPNPATSEITIRLNKGCDNCMFEISNALGQTLKAEKLLSLDNKINISGFANGVYYVKVKSDTSASSVHKIVVQH